MKSMSPKEHDTMMKTQKKDKKEVKVKKKPKK